MPAFVLWGTGGTVSYPAGIGIDFLNLILVYQILVLEMLSINSKNHCAVK